MKNFALLILVALFPRVLISQINAFYTNLNFSNCTSGFFWDEFRSGNYPPEVDTYSYLTGEEAAQYFMLLRENDIDTSQWDIPKYSSLRNQFIQDKKASHTIPISIAEIKYNRISEIAAQNGWLFATNDVLFQDPNENVFEEKEALIVNFDVSSYDDNKLNFILRDENYFHNYGALPSEISIDFNDGLGFRNVNFNEVVSVTYPSFTSDVEIKVMVERNQLQKKGGFILKHNECVSSFPDPTFPSPWPTDSDPDMIWRISTIVNGENVCGNAYPLISGDFDKPFIFVEGIDFPLNNSQLRNGDFGWCQFTSGISDPGYDYAIVARMPLLLSQVMQHGYDIVLLDFCDGADYLENNGMLLVHLLEMINEVKIGNEPNVVAGASMGGQVSKYALDYMEQNNLDHCSRLWISLDSPHSGANIPIALQQLLDGAQSRSPAASEFINDNLKRPAAKQMLNSQYFEANNGAEVYNPPLRAAWYSLMDTWGYPKKCRTVGIANGNVNGLGLSTDYPGHYEENEPMLDYLCERTSLMVGPEVRFFMMPASGDPYYSDWWGYQSTSTSYASAQVVISEPFAPGETAWGYYLAPAFNSFASSKVIKYYYVPPGLPNFDYAPGGIRNSLQSLVTEINLANVLQEGGCNPITEYNKYHAFIPTASAFGLIELSPFEDIEEYLINHPENRYFDYSYGPSGANEGHSMISEDNLEIFLNEILLGENADGAPLLPIDFTSTSPNDGIFNYGINGFNYIRSMHIHDGAQVFVNKNQVLHYGLNDESTPVEGIFKITTWSGCAASDILVDDLGRLEIGDEVNTRRAELTLRPDSKLTIGIHGTLKINPGSKIIVEKDAELVLHPLAILMAVDGSIIVKEGGKIVIQAGQNSNETCTLKLLGLESAIIFEGGQLHIAANTIFEVNSNGVPGGQVEFKGSNDHELFTGTNSVFKIVGDGPTDVMLKMNGYADLWNANFGAGMIILQDCKVDLTDHGRLWTDMKFQATNVTFEDLFDSEDNEGGNVQVWLTNVCGFTNCNFNNARLYTFNSKAAVNNCDFSGNQSGYYASQGGFNVTNSSFVGCHLESHSLSQLSMVNYSLFEDPEHDLQQLNTKFPCIQDESTVELRVLNSIIRDGQKGIVKDGGVLTLKCNLFEDLNSIALTMEMGDLNMSSSSGAGYNNFHLVGTCIELIGAKSLNMASGYNNLSGFSDMCIIGTMNLKCLSAGACELIRYPHYNYWGAAQNTFPPSPNPIGPFDPFMWSKIELRTVSSLSNCNISYPNGPYCDIYLKDDFISVPTGCGTGIPIVRPVRNLGVTSANTSWIGYDPSSANEQFQLKDLEVDPGNPLLNTTNFEEIALDSALVYAALQMEIYDSLGNDANAIALFHEILTSPLDRNNKDIRWRMEWGRYNMKSAMENMFMQDELTPANNATSFETPVSQYVDVLNTMTDTILTDSTYKEQFYVEIDKGQLFRTLGNPLMARHIYMHLDDCQLDSLEQSILNNWREEVDIELSLLDQYINDGVSPDSISFEVDTTSYTPAIPYSTSNYYFGVWIDSPTSATFVNCGDNPEYRILRQSQNNLAVYPNPSTGLITLQIEQEGLYDLAIYDISGKQIHAHQINFGEGGVLPLDLSGILSTGNYMIVIENEYGMMLSKLVIAD